MRFYLLKRLSAKNQGFTLIELLVVIVIIGILAAIALPSFLNQANKAKQSEAKTYVGSLNRGQQAFYLENSEFSDNIEDLGIGIKTETENYLYSIIATNGSDSANAINHGESRKDALKAYVGKVQLGQLEATGEATTLAVLCENDKPGQGKAAEPSSTPDCVEGTKSLAR
jgi:type IV pilus assembly protein PilA